MIKSSKDMRFEIRFLETHRSNLGVKPLSSILIKPKSHIKTCHLFLLYFRLIYQFLDNLLPGK